MHAQLLRAPGGLVGAAVIDDEDLDRVDPVDAPREVRDGGREVIFLVQAGDWMTSFIDARASYPVDRLSVT